LLLAPISAAHAAPVHHEFDRLAAPIKGMLIQASDRALDKLARPGAFSMDDAIRIILPGQPDEASQLVEMAGKAGMTARLQDAINHFGVVLEQDEKHAHSEIWREIGATYLAASMFREAKDALEKFIERRPYDPEGLYYYGKTLEQLAQRDSAHELFSRCVEAVKTMPSYRYREHRKWDKLARDRLAARQAA